MPENLSIKSGPSDVDRLCPGNLCYFLDLLLAMANNIEW